MDQLRRGQRNDRHVDRRPRLRRAGHRLSRTQVIAGPGKRAVSLMAVLGCTGGAGATIRNGAADAAAEVGGGGDLRGAAPFPFLPSNVPLAALVGAEGKLVFDAESCGGRSEVEIDTTEGSVGCPGGEAAPRFRSRRVVDAGGNGLALLVARSLLIERKMVVSVRG